MESVMLDEQNIEDLLSKARGGDREALEFLAHRHRKDLLAFVTSRLGPGLRAGLDPADIVQNTFLKAFQGLDRFQRRGPDSFRRWLFAIAEHLIRNSSRKRSASSVSLQRLSLETAASGPSPSQALRREERFQRLQKAMEGLSPDHRRVIELAWIEGRKIQDIAERMQRSPGAVKQLLSRALEQLKSRFGDTESLGLPDRCLELGDDKNG